MVHSFFPRVAYAITLLHRHHEPAEPETPDAAEIDREVAVVAAENDWQKYRRMRASEPYASRLLFILPKIGPLKLIDVKGPTRQQRPHTCTAWWSHDDHAPDARAVYASRDCAHAHGPSRRSCFRESISASDSGNHGRQPEHAAAIKRPASSAAQSRPRYRSSGTARRLLAHDSTYANLLHRLTRQPTRPSRPAQAGHSG